MRPQTRQQRGDIQLDEFLVPLTLTRYVVPATLNAPRTRIARIAREEKPVTADTALRLGKVFKTGGAFWMNLQARRSASSGNCIERLASRRFYPNDLSRETVSFPVPRQSPAEPIVMTPAAVGETRARRLTDEQMTPAKSARDATVQFGNSAAERDGSDCRTRSGSAQINRPVPGTTENVRVTEST